MKRIIALALLVSAISFSFAAEQFKGTATAGNKTKLTDIAVLGLQFIALNKALNACMKAGNELCGLVEISDKSNKRAGDTFEVVVEALGEKGKKIREWDKSFVGSGDWTSTVKFTNLEIDGIKMKTIQDALKICQKQWSNCAILPQVNMKLVNDQYYDLEWNTKAYKTYLEVVYKGFRY